jgi:sugar transferase (PEP-CTERM/EpsH1 system associated)
MNDTPPFMATTRDPAKVRASPSSLGAATLDGRPLVMHVVYRFGVGGLENGIVNLLNRLPESEFRHAIVALTECDPQFSRRIERDDVELISLGKPPGNGWRVFGKMRRVLLERRPAIVHTRNIAALEMQLPAWAARVPACIHGEHGWDISDPGGMNRRYRLVRRAHRPFVAHYVAVSADLARYLRNVIGVRADRISCICNGVDEKKFSPVQGPMEAASIRPLVIGTVGRLQEIKGQATLIEAVHALVEQEPAKRRTLRVRFIGDGPLRRALERDAAERGLSDVVEFLGARDDVAACMRQLDVFVLPSLAEGISNTILEAMATGLPVVATAVGGNVELVTPAKTGLLVPPADPSKLAHALGRYLDSAELRQTHGVAARADVEARFALSGMVEQYRTLYHDVLATHGLRVPIAAH